MKDSTIENHSDREQNSKKDVDVEVDITPSQPRHTLEEYERLFAVDEDAYEQPTTTRKELWSYYLYYNGRIPFFHCRGQMMFIKLICVPNWQETTASAQDRTVKPCMSSAAYLRGGQTSLTNTIKLSMGPEWCWFSTWHESAEALHQLVALRGTLGRRHEIHFLSHPDRQRTLLYLYDSDFCLAR